MPDENENPWRRVTAEDMPEAYVRVWVCEREEHRIVLAYYAGDDGHTWKEVDGGDYLYAPDLSHWKPFIPPSPPTQEN